MSKEELSVRRNNLSPSKRAMLEKLLRGKPRSAAEPAIPRRAAQDHAPLSFAQQRLWFLDQLVPNNPFYIVPAAVRLTGRVDVKALESSLNQVVRRHESLRTSFATVDGRPLQVIAESLSLAIPVIDLRDVQESERAKHATALTIEEARQPFDLTRAPLLRVKLLRLADEEHLLLLMMHHIISDEWSIGVLLREMSILYDAALNAREAALPDLSIQYADFAAWQQGWLEGEVLERQLAYWKRQLGDSPPAFELPADYQRPPEPSFQGGKQPLVIAQDLVAALKQLSDSRGATLFMTLFAAFNALLYRYTGQQDIVVGSPIANRNRSEIESLIGCFINMVALRTDLSGDPTFEELIKRVKGVALGAYAHQDLPFERLVDELHPERDLSRNPLFNMIFVLQNVPMPSMELSGLRLTPIDVSNGTAVMDFVMALTEGPDGVRGYIEYSSDLFDEETIARLAAHFETLLKAVVAGPRRRISQLPLLTEAERQLLARWNDTQADSQPERRIHRLIEWQAERSPEAAALIHEQQTVSYQELNRKANELAHYLRSLGVGPETVVGVCVECSVEMVVALLGVLKAGAAYLPLDPAYPKERLLYMIEDARAGLLLTQERLRQKIADGKLRIVSLDADWQEIAAHVDDNPTDVADADNGAYVVYTSGSTGIPKGIAVPHRALANECLAFAAHHGLKPGERLLQFASIGFDVAAEEIFAPLLSGATIVLRRNQQTVTVADLLGWVDQYKVSVLNLPAAYWHEWVNQLGESRSLIPASLRLVIVGNEKALIDRYRKWREIIKDRIEWKNAYGPSEATITTTIYKGGESRNEERLASLPIGRPIRNAQVYVLDENMALAPPCVAGELYIGGEGLARGYLNRPDLTAEKFIPNPFTKRRGERLYKTGDLARYRSDGNIEFLGRADHQVKVRGFRIELGEIETVLSRHPLVRDSVVLAREDTPGDKRLVAYLALDGSEPPARSELRAFLRETLPDYMVPAAFVFMDALPLTASGKVDRRALPAPDSNRDAMSHAFVPARNAKEQLLAQIWAQALGLEKVGIHDNFFELGGDSILSIQVIARANRVGLRLTPKQMFQHQTIAGLAAVVDAAARVEAEQGPVTGSVPLTPIQRWFFEQELAAPHHYNQAVLLETKRALDVAALQKALSRLIAHHDALRLRFVRSREGWEQTNQGPDCELPLTRIDLSGVSREGRATALEAKANELQASLDLARGPLIRVALFDLGQGEPGRLLVVVHHLAIDGISWRILLEDLEAAYLQASRGEEVRLPAKTTSFKRWAELLSEYARTPAALVEASYWLDERRREVKRLPLDFASGDNLEAATRTVEVELSREQTRALLAEVPKAFRAQINETLLAALAKSLAEWTGEPSVLVDLEGHGREQIVDGADLSRTLGWFTTIYPVLLQVEAGGPGSALKGVKEQLRGVPNRGIGYGILRYLSGDQPLSSALRGLPEAEISFNYLGQIDQALDASRLFALSRESSGSPRSPQDRRSHKLEIDAWVIDERLRLDWKYSESLHATETIERLASRYIASLEQIIAHCLSGQECGYTPSDFPLAKLDQAALDRLVAADRHIEDIYPLTPMQQGMLFHSLYEPESGMYVTQLACVLRGKLDEQAFEQAWQDACARHAVLRTSIEWEGLEEPLQIVRDNARLTLEKEDWRGLGKDEQARLLESRLTEQRRRGFDFRRAPLMQVALMRTGEDEFQFIWNHHHLLLDGWSTARLIKEVFASYQAHLAGEQAQIEASRPYRDYIAWIKEQDEAKAEAYWREALKGYNGAAARAEMAQGEETEAERYGECQIELGSELTQALSRYARERQLTLNTLVQGAWSLLLSRYSGEEDVVFGATVSGRSMGLEGVEQMMGLFINTLPVRVQVRGEAVVEQWLGELQAMQAEQREYEYSSLSQIQRWTGGDRGGSLFDSIVVFENYPVDESLREQMSAGGSLKIEAVRSVEPTNYALTVGVLPKESLIVQIGYERRLYEESAIERMLGHLARLLREIVAMPDRRLKDLNMMTDGEMEQLLVTWNDTASDYPRDKCIHELFEAQVERSPQEIAVICEGQQLTYAELNGRANQLAAHLRSRAVRPQELVAVCLERSAEMVVALMGVAKAGAGYLPLDPANPAERMRMILEQTAARIIITERSLLESIGAERAEAICIDADWDEISAHGQDNLENIAAAENTVYVVYTSGSTGIPKGIAVPHRALANECLAFAAHHGLKPGERLLQFASIGFDVAAEEVFAPLLSGATVVLRRSDSGLSINELLGWVEEDDLSVLNLPAAYWHEWVNELSRTAARLPQSLRLVIVGNEKALIERYAAWKRAVKDRIEWKNAYGPTEATITTTIYKPGKQFEEGCLKTLPIGRPIANAQTYILDRYLNPVPVGVAGELHIGGAGLAQGYFADAAQTAEKFIPSPFSKRRGERLYKTGDLARYLEDGNIEFLGRLDDQVKVRGYRIELGEIESALLQHELIREAVAIVREEVEGDKRLVAYIVPEGEAMPDSSELRSYLRQRLPDYMAPSAYVRIDRLPLTPNGKVDRRALPAPQQRQGETNEEIARPRTDPEQAMVRIWKQVLGLESVGIHDSFFDLGGDSILSLQIVSRCNEAGMRLTPKQIFQHQTIANLAAAAGTAQPVGADRGEVTGPVPLTPIQRWLFEREMPEPNLYYHSMMLEVEAGVNRSALKAAAERLVEHHDALRMRFRRGASGWTQDNLASKDVDPFRQIDLSHVESRELETAMREAVSRTESSLSLEDGRVALVAFIDLGPHRPGRLLMVIHHLVVDGVSWRILLEDLRRAYEQAVRGERINLGPKTTPFKQWAQWLNEYARSEEVARELSYWREQGGKQAAQLPAEDLGGENDEASARVVSVKLSQQDTLALTQRVPGAYHTRIDEVLMAALLMAFKQWSGERSLKVEVEGHGREDIAEELDVTRTVGWFTTAYPVWLESAGAEGEAELLKNVKEQLRSIPRRGIGYGLLRYLSEEESIRQEMKAIGEAGMSFNYLGQADNLAQPEAGFQMAREPVGLARSLAAKRSHLIEVDAIIESGSLQVDWTYSENRHRRAQIEDLANKYLEALARLIAHCLSQEAGGFTPSDFPYARLSQQELDDFISELSEFTD